MPPTKRIYLTLGLVLAMLLFAACAESGTEPAPSDSQDDTQAATEVEAEDESADEAPEVEEEAEEAAEPEEPSLPPLPSERQAVEIITADGRTLEGYYYPAASNPAPIVVLMHWAGGDMEDWREIAPWLQNRANEVGGAGVAAAPAALASDPWLDPSWFPPMPPEISFGVLIFNFGDFGNSESGNIDAGAWAEDARAPMAAAAELDGVDPQRMAALGASIGADGAVDGCYLYNMDNSVEDCQGALSLSPGDYRTQEFTYAEAVEFLDDLSKPVWCLSATGDVYSYATCESAQGDHYLRIYYPNDFHGMDLVRPDYLPTDPPLGVDTLVIIQDFLEEVFGLAIN